MGFCAGMVHGIMAANIDTVSLFVKTVMKKPNKISNRFKQVTKRQPERFRWHGPPKFVNYSRGLA